MGHWADGDDGVVVLASGRRVRARELARAEPVGREPEFGVYFSPFAPGLPTWPAAWVPWSQTGLPVNRSGAEAALREAWRRCSDERVELACVRGRAAMGTALACLAVLDGALPSEAVRLVKAQVDNWTVGTPWARLFIGSFARQTA